MIYKKLRLWLLAQLLAYCVVAQEGKPVIWGFNGGLSLSSQQLRGSDASFGSINRFRFAAVAERAITHRLSLAAELAFAPHGSVNPRYNGQVEKLNYAELNLQAIEYLPTAVGDAFLSAGLYTAYGINGKREGVPGNAEANIFKESGYKRLEFGAITNFGFKLRSGTYFQGGFKVGFNNCYELDRFRYYNFAVLATVGQSLGWQKKKSRSFRKKK
ncbi:MAG: hypothetical protein EAY75_14300 [Bacteroidetes bacterium]|nr:MAG: hypothetical protein EAY75_14300 [Bacteroidota bacterium]